MCQQKNVPLGKQRIIVYEILLAHTETKLSFYEEKLQQLEQINEEDLNDTDKESFAYDHNSVEYLMSKDEGEKPNFFTLLSTSKALTLIAEACAGFVIKKG